MHNKKTTCQRYFFSGRFFRFYAFSIMAFAICLYSSAWSATAGFKYGCALIKLTILFPSKHNLHRFLHAMRHASQCAAVTHGPEKLFLILAWLLARFLNFDVKRSPIPGTMPAQIGLTRYADARRPAVFRVQRCAVGALDKAAAFGKFDSDRGLN